MAPLFLALAACGGHDSPSGPGSQGVAGVEVSGVPAGVVLTGTTVQLVATPVTASGAALSRTVSWRTSDSTVATVGSTGLVSVVGAGLVTITAACEGKEGSASLDARATAPLPTTAGTITLLDGRIVLVTAAGTVSTGTTLVARPAPSPPQDARMVPGTAWELGPSGLVFHQPVALSLRYDPARLPAGLSEGTLQLYLVASNGAWRQVAGSRLDAAAHRVTGLVYGTGVYGVIGTAVSKVVARGTPRDAALYVGQAFNATATAFDVNNDSLPGSVFTWTTSNAGVAAIDAQGRVTGQAPGTATITAALDGRQASTTVTVLPRVVPSWSQGEEWGTFQGNARHDGHVAATLDPLSFHELWSRTVVNARLNPVATGGGKVFVSTYAHYGQQLLFAIDAATGSQAWSRDFGEIATVGPPAFGNGRVYVMTGGHDDSFLWSMDASDGTPRFQSPYRNQFSRWEAPVVTPAGVFLAGGYSGGAYRFDADGAEMWAVTLPQVDGWTPAVAGGQVFAYGKLDIYTAEGLVVLNAGTGKLAYQVDDARLPSAGTPVLGGAGNVLTVKIPTGTLLSTSLQSRAVQWAVQDQFDGTPVVAAGVVYTRNAGRVDARRESDGTLLWSWKPPAGGAQGDIVLTDNLLFVRVNTFDEQATYAVDLASGKHVWFYPAGGFLALSAQGTLFIADENGRVVAVAVR